MNDLVDGVRNSYRYDRWLQFQDKEVSKRYDEYLRENRLAAGYWVTFIAVIGANFPYLVNSEALIGKYGPLNQFATVNFAGNYVLITVMVFVCAFEKYLPSSAKDIRMVARIIFITYNQPVTATLSLFNRTYGPACNPSMSLGEFYFCNAATGGLVPADGFVGWLLFSLAYQVMMPVRFRWHLAAWCVGLFGLCATIHSAVTGSGISSALFGDSVVIFVYLMFLLLQFAIERRSMREFFLSESKTDHVQPGDVQPGDKFELAESAKTTSTTVSMTDDGFGLGFFDPLWGTASSIAPSLGSFRSRGAAAAATAVHMLDLQSGRGGASSTTSSLTDSYVDNYYQTDSDQGSINFEEETGGSYVR